MRREEGLGPGPADNRGPSPTPCSPAPQPAARSEAPPGADGGLRPGAERARARTYPRPSEASPGSGGYGSVCAPLPAPRCLQTRLGPHPVRGGNGGDDRQPGEPGKQLGAGTGGKIQAQTSTWLSDSNRRDCHPQPHAHSPLYIHQPALRLIPGRAITPSPPQGLPPKLKGP